MAKKDGGLRDEFRKRMPKLHWTTIENALVQNGVPDSNYCYNSVEGWVEYKWTKGYAVHIRPDQIAWIARRTRAGGNVIIAIRRQSTDDDELWLYSGADVLLLSENGLSTAHRPLARFSGGPRRWPWAKVEKILLFE